MTDQNKEEIRDFIGQYINETYRGLTEISDEFWQQNFPDFTDSQIAFIEKFITETVIGLVEKGFLVEPSAIS